MSMISWCCNQQFCIPGLGGHSAHVFCGVVSNWLAPPSQIADHTTFCRMVLLRRWQDE
jgi:hypothetical protein